MNSRDRLLTVLQGGVPDCVPVCPDISNMVPAKMTGKPFWDIYVYEDPPLWKAHIDAIKHFGFDGGFEVYRFGDIFGDMPAIVSRIVQRYEDGKFVTQDYYPDEGRWDRYVQVHTVDNPPAYSVKPSQLSLPDVPEDFEEITGVKEWPKGFESWRTLREYMGGDGILGMPSGMQTALLHTADDVYDYYENPGKFFKAAEHMMERVRKRLSFIETLEGDDRPDFLMCGASGSLVLQSPQIFRELILPMLKETTRLAKGLSIPTHVHSCGPEAELVRMAVEETDLTIIDPLEIAPMGDCDLRALKREFGDKIVLKGNLHTTDVMLHGSVQNVIDASKRAIDDAAEGGGFILSTGDQCGRDTPHENIMAMIETARTYGRYN